MQPHRMLLQSLEELDRVIDANLQAARLHRDQAISELDALADERIREIRVRIVMTSEDLQRTTLDGPERPPPF